MPRFHLVGWLRGKLDQFMTSLQDGESLLECSGSSQPMLRCRSELQLQPLLRRWRRQRRTLKQGLRQDQEGPTCLASLRVR